MLDWQKSMQAWGNNASPAWNVLDALLAGDDPVSGRQLGWRRRCIARIFWGTTYLGMGLVAAYLVLLVAIAFVGYATATVRFARDPR